MTHERITSRDNPLLKDIRKLVSDNTAYRKQGRVWLEGEHLLLAAQKRCVKIDAVIYSEDFKNISVIGNHQSDIKKIAISDKLFAELSSLDQSARIGFMVTLGPQPAVDPLANTLILDRVQDAGNVGSMLRSAAAFGFTQVLALKGTAALWSSKVTRAGMGAHFGLQLIEGASAQDVQALQVPVLGTSSHQGHWLGSAPLPAPCAWAMGHEGQGLGPQLQALARQWVRIRQPGGEESLNVASAAAICMHASSLQGSGL
ncbi:MAG: hypothetical protein RLZZ126_1788 [Pseudomonadota bacterium]|jgi:RNA methyltransferase, TrmH family